MHFLNNLYVFMFNLLDSVPQRFDHPTNAFSLVALISIVIKVVLAVMDWVIFERAYAKKVVVIFVRFIALVLRFVDHLLELSVIDAL